MRLRPIPLFDSLSLIRINMIISKHRLGCKDRVSVFVERVNNQPIILLRAEGAVDMISLEFVLFI